MREYSCYERERSMNPERVAPSLVNSIPAKLAVGEAVGERWGCVTLSSVNRRW
jgi:hypothetical protein